ncbi:MAG: hypothetical protein ACRBCJ_13790 [Hyphomicrobiaceae bacterium]
MQGNTQKILNFLFFGNATIYTALFTAILPVEKTTAVLLLGTSATMDALLFSVKKAMLEDANVIVDLKRDLHEATQSRLRIKYIFALIILALLYVLNHGIFPAEWLYESLPPVLTSYDQFVYIWVGMTSVIYAALAVFFVPLGIRTMPGISKTSSDIEKQKLIETAKRRPKKFLMKVIYIFSFVLLLFSLSTFFLPTPPEYVGRRPAEPMLPVFAFLTYLFGAQACILKALSEENSS